MYRAAVGDGAIGLHNVVDFDNWVSFIDQDLADIPGVLTRLDRNASSLTLTRIGDDVFEAGTSRFEDAFKALLPGSTRVNRLKKLKVELEETEEAAEEVAEGQPEET